MKHYSPKYIKMYFKTIVIYNVFRTRFPTYGKLSFVMGKLHFPQVGICVTKPLCFPMNVEANPAKILKLYIESIVFYNVFRTQFPTCGKWSFPIGKVNKVYNRNSVLESFCFPMIPEHFLIIITKKYFISIVFYNVFSTRFPTPQNPMNSNSFCTAAAAAAPAALAGGQAGPRADSGN